MFQSNINKIAEKYYFSNRVEIIELFYDAPIWSGHQIIDDFVVLSGLEYRTSDFTRSWKKVKLDIELGVKDKGLTKCVGHLTRRQYSADKHISRIDLFSSDYIFISWGGKTTDVYCGDSKIGNIEMRGTRSMILTDKSGVSFTFKYSMWPWRLAECSGDNFCISYPYCWPSGGKLSINNVNAILQLKEECRNLIAFAIIWRCSLFYHW